MSAENKNTQIAISDFNDVARMSKLFYESGMFTDLASVAQAGVKILAGAELGISPFQAVSGVHIIKGKPVIGAGLMASMLDRHPEYDFEVLQQTDKVCEIKFYKNGKAKGTSKFTIEDAQKAGTQNLNKFPANMLYARAMSNGVKWYAPGIFAGPVYVPEEIQEPETHDTSYIEVKQPKQPEPEAVDAEVVEEPEEAESKAKPIERKQPGNALDVPASDAAKPYASDEQKQEIIALLNNPVITNQEKTKQLLNINRFDEERAAQCIQNLKAVIEGREEEQKKANQ